MRSTQGNWNCIHAWTLHPCARPRVKKEDWEGDFSVILGRDFDKEGSPILARIGLSAFNFLEIVKKQKCKYTAGRKTRIYSHLFQYSRYFLETLGTSGNSFFLCLAWCI